MTNWKTRATAIREEGTAARRDWNPSADSIHWKIYVWWLNHGGNYPERENFCHFWRVVIFWAPLKWVTQPLRSPKFWAGVGILAATLIVLGLVLVAVKWPSEFFATVGVLLAAAWVITGIGYFIHCGGMLFDEKSPFRSLRWLEMKNYGIYALITLFYLPVMAAALLFCLALFVVAGLLIAPFEHYKVHERIGKLHPQKYPWANPYTAAGVAAVLAVLYSAYNGSAFSRGFVAVVAGIAAVVGLVFFASWLFDVAKRNAKAKRNEQNSQLIRDGVDFLIRTRFEIEHPDKVNDAAKFAAWRERYIKYFEARWDDPYWASNAWYHLRYIEAAFDRKYPYLADYSHFPDTLQRLRIAGPPVVRTGPSVGSKIVEFGSFVWSVVLVNKWRTCPIVEMPQAAR